MIASILGTLLSEYRDENTKLLNSLKKKVRIYMMQESIRAPREFNEAIKHTDIVWRDAINHFANDNLKIEAGTLIIKLYSVYDVFLRKNLKITDKQMEKFIIWHRYDNSVENDTFKVADYLIDELAKITKVERKKINFKGKA